MTFVMYRIKVQEHYKTDNQHHTSCLNKFSQAQVSILHSQIQVLPLYRWIQASGPKQNQAWHYLLSLDFEWIIMRNVHENLNNICYFQYTSLQIHFIILHECKNKPKKF